MITCNECGRTNGHGDIGDNWICGDCKVTGGEARLEEGPQKAD